MPIRKNKVNDMKQLINEFHQQNITPNTMNDLVQLLIGYSAPKDREKICDLARQYIKTQDFGSNKRAKLNKIIKGCRSMDLQGAAKTKKKKKGEKESDTPKISMKDILMEINKMKHKSKKRDETLAKVIKKTNEKADKAENIAMQNTGLINLASREISKKDRQVEQIKDAQLNLKHDIKDNLAKRVGTIEKEITSLKKKLTS